MTSIKAFCYINASKTAKKRTFPYKQTLISSFGLASSKDLSSKFVEFGSAERFCQTVGDIISGADFLKQNLSIIDLLLYNVIVDVDMLYAAMPYRIIR